MDDNYKIMDDYYKNMEDAEDVRFFRYSNYKITGDALAALLLSKIVYWFRPGKTGRKKTRVVKDGRDWIAKKRKDWDNECCLSERQFDRAIKILKDQGLVETKVYKFAGDPQTHISLNGDVFMEKLTNYHNNKTNEEVLNEE